MPLVHAALPTPAEIDALLGYAVRAPSLLNTQPWRFVVDDGTVRLYADRSRQLLALDPDGRELTMSCGASLAYLSIAARHEGWTTDIHSVPDADDPDLLATVAFRPAAAPYGDDRLFRALSQRRTNRRPFAETPVPVPVWADLADAADAENATLHVFDRPADRSALSRLVADGVLTQSTDRDVLGDIQRWLRGAGDPRPDGVRDSAQGVWDRHAAVRTPPTALATYKARLIADAPAVLVLSTAGDTPVHWLDAGRALTRVLVAAADRGLSASYANEPIEVATLREQVAIWTGGDPPQALFRVGYPTERPETARRYASEVTEHAG